jgi:hypothetical protein
MHLNGLMKKNAKIINIQTTISFNQETISKLDHYMKHLLRHASLSAGIVL